MQLLQEPLQPQVPKSETGNCSYVFAHPTFENKAALIVSNTAGTTCSGSWSTSLDGSDAASVTESLLGP